MRINKSLLFPLLLLFCSPLFAGGPIYVGGNFGPSGKPFTWDNSKPVQYRVDGGTLGKLTHTQAVQMVDAAFNAWANVPTAKLTLQNAGAIPATGAFTDGDVSTIEEFDAVWGLCSSATATNAVSPIVFDSDGSLLRDLGADDGILGFESTCSWGDDGHFISALMVINGGVYTGKAGDLTADEMSAVIEHEFGHFLGLDHSQINMACINSQNCTSADIAGIPTMFPLIFVGSGGPQKSLSEDDQAWVSYLYPVTVASGGKVPFSSVYSIISGNVLFSDGLSGAQGVNVYARKYVNGVADHANTYSNVSGYLFTGNPGQAVTGTNISEFTQLPGSDFGSRDATLIGHFDIPVRAGASYVLEIEAIDWDFVGGSSVGPVGQDPPEGRGTNLPLPGPASTVGPIAVAVGTNSGNNNIQAQSGPSRFDQYESH